MNTIECKVTVGPNGRITLPTDVARQLPAGEILTLTLCWDTAEEDEAVLDEEMDEELIDEPLTR